MRPHVVDLDSLNALSRDLFPAYVGFVVTAIEEGVLRAEIAIQPEHLAPNGFLHAGVVATLADTAAGYGTVAHLPDGAHAFTTLELKLNFLQTARAGVLRCEARAAHLGRTTQVWDATVTDDGGRTIALFRCTQLVLYPRANSDA